MFFYAFLVTYNSKKKASKWTKNVTYLIVSWVSVGINAI